MNNRDEVLVELLDNMLDQSRGGNRLLWKT